MEFYEQKEILKFIRINILSKNKTVFYPSSSPKEPINLQFISVTDYGIVCKPEKEPPDFQGKVGFFSFHFYMTFTCELCHKYNLPDDQFFIFLPKQLTTGDRRKSPRLFFESQENKIVNVQLKRCNQCAKAILFNLSAGGFAFFLTDLTVDIKPNDEVHLDANIVNVPIHSDAVIRHIDGSLVGCMFQNTSLDFRKDVDKLVLREIQWRSEHFIKYLERKEQIVEKIRESEEQKGLRKQQSINYLDFINPFLESATAVVSNFTGITLEKKELKFEKVCTGVYDASTYFDCVSKDFKFQLFLCLKEEVLLKTAEIVFDRKVDAINEEVNDLLGELGNMIVGNAKNNLDSSHYYKLSTPGIIIGKRHLLSTLSQYPSIRLIFGSEIGDFDIILFVSDVIEKISSEELKTFDIFAPENIEFIEPIFNSTINIFSNFLQLDIKEKGISMRNPLVPKFEISAILGISGDKLEGKIVLNLSKKLAMKIYEILLNEKTDEFNEYVKDAVGEILNMITGNAKGEFQDKNIYYRLSTPFIVEGKDQTIKNVGNTPFVSSIYWTSQGFFELCYTIYPG